MTGVQTCALPISARKKRYVKHEIQIIKMLHHPNIVRIFETIEDSNYLYLVFEYIKGGSLFEYLNSRPHKKLDEGEVKRIFRQIVSTVQYCHKQNVAHRDLKLENILLDEKHNVKIIDFGFAVIVNTVCKLDLVCGTTLYMAPEIVNHKDYWGPPVDVWSLGVILYVMLSGRFPFTGSNSATINKNIVKGSYIMPREISTSAQNLIAKLLSIDPENRPKCDEIMRDRFLYETSDENSIQTSSSFKLEESCIA